MKRLSFLLLLSTLILFVNCEGEAPEIISEKYETSTDSLYIKCSDLKGLGSLHIGNTLYKHLRRDTCITIDKLLHLKSDFYGGYWGVNNFDIEKYIHKNKKIKQVRVSNLAHPYIIGNLEFDEMDLAFLNDTLVAISIGSDFYKIEDFFVDKYGVGQGFHEFYCKSKGEWGDKNYFIEKKEHKHRVWANEKVKLEKKYDMKSKVVNNEVVYSFKGDDYCLITSQTRYDEFLRILKESKSEYWKLQSAQTKKSYEML